MNEHETQRRGRRAAVFAVAAALALLAAPARAGLLSSDDTRECGCTKKGNYTWAEHLTLWSNMVSIVRNVNESYNAASDAAKAAQGEWINVENALEPVAAAERAATRLNDTARELQNNCSAYIARDDNAALKNLIPQLEELFGEFGAQKRAWEGLRVDALSSAAGRDALSEERNRKKFDEEKRRFADWYRKADDFRFQAVSLACVNNEWLKIRDLKDELDRADASFARGRDEARERREGLARQQKKVADSFLDVETKISGIGREFGLPPNSATNAILDAIVDRTVERVSVEFLNVPSRIPTIHLKKGFEKLVRPTPDPTAPAVDGPGFLYWRVRDAEERFEGWDKPVDASLRLEAVWGFRIDVDGFKTLEFPAYDWNDTLSASTVVNNPELAEYAERLKKGPADDPGRIFDGWATTAEPDIVLTARSGLLRNRTTITPHRSVATFRVTFVVPGGTPPAPIVWTYNADGPFPVPPALPPDTANGFHYVRWSLDPNGSEEWTGGTALTGNLTVYAVREADFRISFRDEDGAPIGESGAKKGERFSLLNAPRPPVKPGRTFVEWRHADGRTFDGTDIAGDLEVLAEYRDETPEEAIRRYLEPISSRVGIHVLAAADVALLVLLVVLLATGRGPRSPKPRKSEDAPGAEPEEKTAEADGAEAKAEGGETPAA